MACNFYLDSEALAVMVLALQRYRAISASVKVNEDGFMTCKADENSKHPPIGREIYRQDSSTDAKTAGHLSTRSAATGDAHSNPLT